jgi:CRP/FNR family cyclic AMP-dependent transcriptional regulator
MAPSAIPRKRASDCSTCDLRGLRMFCNLDDAALADFAAIGSAAVFQNKQHIFHQQQAARVVAFRPIPGG